MNPKGICPQIHHTKLRAQDGNRFVSASKGIGLVADELRSVITMAALQAAWWV